MRLLVFGLGYSGSAVAARLAARCEWIGGTTRSVANAAAIEAKGIEPLLFDGTTSNPALDRAVRDATHVLVSISPFTDRHHIATGNADPVLAAFGDRLSAAPNAAGRAVVYLSTIGVYGDAGGEWVDEDTAAEPRNERTVARRIAEDAWLELGRATGAAVSVLRLSGIYGPGRNVFLNLEDGSARRIVKPGQVFNRIHVDDIAQAVEKAFDTRSGGIFNITDDEPTPPQDVIAFAAGLMGVEPPPELDFATADLSPMARSFYGSNKRVSNARSKRVLGMDYAWPDYRQALARMWREQRLR